MKYASDFRRIARDALQDNWLVAGLTGFVASLMGASLWGGSSGGSGSDTDSLSDTIYQNLDDKTLKLFLSILTVILIVLVVLMIVAFIIGGAAKFGYAIFNLNLVDGKEARFSDLFSQFHRIGSGIIMNLLMGIFTFLWTLLFIIPGIIKSFSYAMTPFILAENPEISENEAITRSRQLMDGNKWRLFCLMFSFIGWELLVCCPFLIAVVFLCVAAVVRTAAVSAGVIVFLAVSFVLLLAGQFFLTPYQHAALAAFYRDISGDHTRENRIPTPWDIA